MKKAIAMKCTQEQFDAVKRKLKNVNSITNFKDWPYLVNCDEGGTISNIREKSFNWVWNKKPEIHETWNEKIFLEACGIETEENYRITKEQLEQAHNAGFIRIKEWFPSAFEKELEVDFTGWAKCKTSNKWIVYFEKGVFKYGIDSEGKWFKKSEYYNFKAGKPEFKATTQEVEVAFESEIRRRYKIGDKIKCLNNGDIKEVYLKGNVDYYAIANDAYYAGVQVFNKGKWATIIPTISREEAEERLGVKIE